MRKQIGRRKFLKTLGTGAVVLIGAACAPAAAPTAAPTAAPKPEAKPPATTVPAPAAPAATTAPAPAVTAAAKPAATTGVAKQGDRVVVAVAQWGIETPFAWRSSQSEKTLWDAPYDALVMRDPKTFQFKPGLATSWDHSADYKTWTFKLRQGVMFHENYGELTSDDVKFVVEQNLKPDSQGGSAPFFRQFLDKIDTPDKYTVVLRFKSPTWATLTHFSQFLGYQNVISKKYFEQVGEEKAALHPIGTGPWHHVEGRQGDFHRFEAVQNHWRQTPGFKELVVRRVADPATRLAGLRAGEIDVAGVYGDYLDQAKKAGLTIHETPGSAQYWVVLTGQTTPDRPDYNPKLPWTGDPNDPKSQANALKVRQALNLAVNKQAIVDGLWKGSGALTPYVYFYYPVNKGFSQDWKVPPYDLPKAKQLLAEAGYPNGFEINVTEMAFVFANDGADVMEAVALDWERLGLKVKRANDDWGNFLPKDRARKTGNAAWIYAPPAFDEPSLAWERAVWTKGAFQHLAENAELDKDLEAILAEMDEEKRSKLTHDFGQKLYDRYYGVMLGTKSTTWALGKKVADWQTLVYAPLETNYEYLLPA